MRPSKKHLKRREESKVYAVPDVATDEQSKDSPTSAVYEQSIVSQVTEYNEITDDILQTQPPSDQYEQSGKNIHVDSCDSTVTVTTPLENTYYSKESYAAIDV